MQRLRPLLVLLSIGLLLTACGGATPAQPTGTPPPPTATSSPPTATPSLARIPAGSVPAVLTDPNGHFSFTTPQGWTAAATRGAYDVVTLTSPRAPADFTVTTFDLASGSSLTKFTAEFTARVKGITGYAPGPLGTQSLTLGGEPAQQIDYFATTDAGVRAYVIQIFSVKGPTAYVLTYTRQQDDTASASETAVIVGTWKFL